IIGIGRRYREGLIPPRDELLLQILIGLLQRARAGHAQPFHQAVLRCLKGSFHASFGLRRVRRNPGDPQFLQRPPDLRGWHFRPVLALPLLSSFGFHRRLKYPCPIGVAPHRTTVLLHVALQHFHVLFSRVLPHKT